MKRCHIEISFLRKAEYDAEMEAKLHEATRVAGEGFVDFNPAMFVSPMSYGKAYLDMITASVSFIGNLLQSNKDDVVCTKSSTYQLIDKQQTLTKKGKIKFTIEHVGSFDSTLKNKVNGLEITYKDSNDSAEKVLETKLPVLKSSTGKPIVIDID